MKNGDFVEATIVLLEHVHSDIDRVDRALAQGSKSPPEMERSRARKLATISNPALAHQRGKYAKIAQRT